MHGRGGRIGGRRLRAGFRLDPAFPHKALSLPITISPTIDEMVPLEKIAWRGRKYGVTARHEFTFSEQEGGTLLTSREVFSGPAMRYLSFLVPLGQLHGITVRLLEDIRREAERSSRR